MSRIFIGALCAWAMVAGSALAQAPAVSQVNGKISAEGGYSKVDGHGGGAGLVQGSLSAPLGSSFGVQIDGGAGALNGGFAWGVGGHLFWRNPAAGLIGLTGSISETNKFGNTRAGAEGEFYLGQFTLAARGGYQWGNNGNHIKVHSGFYGAGDVKFYLSDDFMLFAGGGVYAGEWRVRGGVELQPGLFAQKNLALFAKGHVGENNNYAVTAGLRLYFGADKSLKRRHREDDPEADLFEDNSGEKKKNPSCVFPEFTVKAFCNEQ